MRRYLSLLGLMVPLLPRDGPGSRRPHGRAGRDALAARRDEQHDDTLVRGRERPVRRRPHRLRHDDPASRRSRRRAGALAGAPAAAAPRRRPRPRRRRSRWAATPCARATRSRRSPRPPASRRAPIAAMNGLDPNGVLLAGHRAQAADRLARPGRARRSRRPRTTRVPAGRAVRRRSGRVIVRARSRRSPSRNGVPGVAGLRDRLAGERLQQRDGLQRQRARRHAGHAGHVGLGPGQPRPAPARPQLGDRQRRRRASCTWATCCSETGGDPALAAAGYYQGLASVRSIGMLPETQRYVANVMALRSRFGG